MNRKVVKTLTMKDLQPKIDPVNRGYPRFNLWYTRNAVTSFQSFEPDPFVIVFGVLLVKK